METFTVRDLSFVYPGQPRKVLDGLSFDIHPGEFVTLCGPSGCGKSTLLRQLKTVLAPNGERSGEILFEGTMLDEVGQARQAAAIGFVQQSPENQIVTDKVWHELAFGLESLGYDDQTIRSRVAEMASFFGIQTWFYKDTSRLSGGQKQLLNLASIMVMHPTVLILDEPTSQLDPIAATDFLTTVGRINREFGTTVILTEHRLEEVFPMSDRVLVMDGGRLMADGTPAQVGTALKDAGHSMFLAMPAAMRIWAAVDEGSGKCPVTVRDGRDWLAEYAKTHELKHPEPDTAASGSGATAIEMNDVWFRYERDTADVVKGLDLKLEKGEFLALLGGNGTGKTTAIALAGGLKKPYKGTVVMNGRTVVLPQNPQTLFVKKTVKEDLEEVLKGCAELTVQAERMAEAVSLCRLEELLYRHPYDLSGGEQQRVALAKVLLTEPDILLLDEPTKGLDAEFKQVFAAMIRRLQKRGVSILMVSHDVEFCAEYTDRCALFFDGSIVSEGRPVDFFSGNSFYTTAANRMSRGFVWNAVTVGDLITACGGTVPAGPEIDESHGISCAGSLKSEPKDISGRKTSLQNISNRKTQDRNDRSRKIPKRTLAAAVMILLLIPATILAGVYLFGDRKYYLISLLVLLEIMLPFALVFEGRKPQARELVLIASLCAIGVAGRAVFFMIPSFKPVMALVIISGVAFGGETGFLVGAMTMLVSNVMFGQGPWTPWQMFSMGLIGFIAGIMHRRGLLPSKRLPLSVFGALSTLVIFGGIMNPASALMWTTDLNWKIIMSYYAAGLPMDLVHAAATVIILWFSGEPLLEKLERIKMKYDLM